MILEKDSSLARDHKGEVNLVNKSDALGFGKVYNNDTAQKCPAEGQRIILFLLEIWPTFLIYSVIDAHLTKIILFQLYISHRLF